MGWDAFSRMKQSRRKLALNYFHVCAYHRPCLEFRCWAGCWIQFYRSWVQCPISFWPWSKSMLLPKCHSMSLRIGKKTSFMLAGLSLRENRAMWSFLQAIWKHSENLPPQTSPNHRCSLQVGPSSQSLWKMTLPKKHTVFRYVLIMCWYELIWIIPSYLISEELARATFMKTDQNELRCPKCIGNEAQTATPPLKPQKAKYPHSAASMNTLTMFARALHTSPSLHEISSNLPDNSRGILPKTPPTSTNSTLPTPGGRKSESHRDVRGRRSRRSPGRRRRTFHRPRRSRPMCGYCALQAPFRSGIADSSDWPGQKGPRCFEATRKHCLEIVAENLITMLILQQLSCPVGHLATWP